MNQREFIASLNKTQHLYFAKKSNQAGLKHPAQQWGVMRWLAWNMPYHAEHHVYPTVPFFRLPELHQLTKQHIAVTSDGYIPFNRSYWKMTSDQAGE